MYSTHTIPAAPGTGGPDKKRSTPIELLGSADPEDAVACGKRDASRIRGIRDGGEQVLELLERTHPQPTIGPYSIFSPLSTLLQGFGTCWYGVG